jgi:acyl-CoA reductase-like NAD-dependent aldehyde dehydrogenase
MKPHDPEPVFTLRLGDPRVHEIIEKVIPAFTEADFDEAMTAVVYMFALAISRRPPEVREEIVSATAEPILKISDDMARAGG